MTKGQRTIAVLLGALCVLLALNLMTPGVTATPAPQEDIQLAEYLIGYGSRQTSRPAEAGAAGTCPSDINGDAVVNVLDLVDLLLDFGTECPAPHVVDVAIMPVQVNCNQARGDIVVGTLAFRVWSDGLVEYVTQGPPNLFPQEWVMVNAPPPSESARPVAIAIHGQGHCQPIGGGFGAATAPRAVLQWSDATLRSAQVIQLEYIPVIDKANVFVGSFSIDFP